MLLHNGNKYHSLSLVHSVVLKEKYGSVKTLQDAMKCENDVREVTSDFRIVVLLVGFQRVFVRFPYLCLWDRKATVSHYHKKHCPQRSEFSVGSLKNE